MEHTKEELREKYLQLPKDIQDAIFSVDSADVIREIGEKHKLLIDKIGILADETGLIMLGITHPKDFIPRIMSKLEIDHQTAKGIAKEINERIFSLIRNNLKKLHGIEEEDVLSEQKERPSPAPEAFKAQPPVQASPPPPAQAPVPQTPLVQAPPPPVQAQAPTRSLPPQAQAPPDAPHPVQAPPPAQASYKQPPDFAKTREEELKTREEELRDREESLKAREEILKTIEDKAPAAPPSQAKPPIPKIFQGMNKPQAPEIEKFPKPEPEEKIKLQTPPSPGAPPSPTAFEAKTQEGISRTPAETREIEGTSNENQTQRKITDPYRETIE